MKKILNILSVFSLLILFVFVPTISKASTISLSGYAWSDNVGWISFNSSNVPDSVSYSVNYDSSTGNLTGYAWSDNIGWIQFGCPSGATCLSGFPTGSGTIATNANINSAGVWSGWAKALAADNNGWDGWISLAGSVTGGGSYGVNTNSSTGSTTGWAWGSNVVGWISFNSTNGPTYPPYSVNIPPFVPSAPTSVSAQYTCGAGGPSVLVSWTSVSGASSYNIKRSDGAVIGNTTSNNITDTSLTEQSGQNYSYSVQAVEGNQSSGYTNSNNITTQTCTSGNVQPTSFKAALTSTNGSVSTCKLSWTLTGTSNYSQCAIYYTSSGGLVSNVSTSTQNGNYTVNFSNLTEYTLSCWQNDSNGNKIQSTVVSTQPATCYPPDSFKEIMK